jgi:hypothetical protein
MSKELPVDRKYELMIRDDEFNSYIAKSRQWLRNPNDEALTKEVAQLKKQIRDKWNARIHWPESTIQGVTDFWMLVREPYKAVEDGRNAGGTMILEDGLDLGKMIFASFKHNGLIHCPPHKIPIVIDPTILTLHDAQTVKEEVWKIVKAEIEKRKNTIKGREFPDDLVDFLPVGCIEKKKTIKGRDFAVPAKEPEALAAVFRCKVESFEKYLRWYDLKIAGLSFRLIALIEFHSKSEDRDRKFEEFISKKKEVRNIGPIEEEDTVRKGVGLIYQAIHRKIMSVRGDHIPTLEKYNCPQHGDNCDDIDCDYLKHWLGDFDYKYKDKSLKEQLSPF